MILIKCLCFLFKILFWKKDYDKHKMVILNACGFQKQMLANVYSSDLLIDKCVSKDRFKDSYVMKIL